MITRFTPVLCYFLETQSTYQLVDLLSIFSEMRSTAQVDLELLDCQQKISSGELLISSLKGQIKCVQYDNLCKSHLLLSLNRQQKNVQWVECVMNETRLDLNLIDIVRTFSYILFLKLEYFANVNDVDHEFVWSANGLTVNPRSPTMFIPALGHIPEMWDSGYCPDDLLWFCSLFRDVKLAEGQGKTAITTYMPARVSTPSVWLGLNLAKGKGKTALDVCMPVLGGWEIAENVFIATDNCLETTRCRFKVIRLVKPGIVNDIQELLTKTVTVTRLLCSCSTAEQIPSIAYVSL